MSRHISIYRNSYAKRSKQPQAHINIIESNQQLEAAAIVEATAALSSLVCFCLLQCSHFVQLMWMYVRCVVDAFLSNRIV